MLIRSEVGLSFDDVLLVPHKGKVNSRDEVNLSTHIGGSVWLSIPVVSSPMSTVTEWAMARRLSELGGIGFIHRFMSIEDQVDQWKLAVDNSDTQSNDPSDTYRSSDHWAGCAIGIRENTTKKSQSISYERTHRLYEAGCRLFVCDVAHGYSNSVGVFMGDLSTDIRHNSTFVSGSVATADGARFCAEAGFHSIRVGIGNGSACSTRESTGHGVPQLTALMECREAVNDLKTSNGIRPRIISCGGIRNAGDIVKAIAAGADAVMLGYIIAGTDEAPRGTEYSGQASARAKKEANAEAEYIEGVSGEVKPSGSLEDTLSPLLAGIRSGISYAGAKSVTGLYDVAEFQITAPGVTNESKVRI